MLVALMPNRLTVSAKRRGYGGLTTAGVIAGGSLIGSIGLLLVLGQLDPAREPRTFTRCEKAATVWNLTSGVYRTSGIWL